MSSYVVVEVVTTPPVITILCEDQPILGMPTVIVIASSAPLSVWQDIRIAGVPVIFDRVGDRSLTTEYTFVDAGDVTIRATLKDDVLNEAFKEHVVHVIPYVLSNVDMRREDKVRCNIRNRSSSTVIRNEQGSIHISSKQGSISVRKELPYATLRSEQQGFAELQGEEES